MKIAHQEDVHRHEEMVMSSVARMDEMVQEDQGSTIRIEQLERQRDLLSNAVGHVNQVYQKALDDHQRGIQKIEEASYAQHQRDEELAASLHQELVQLRSDAAQAFTNVEQQAQDQGQQLAMEYQKLVDELNQKAHDTLQFKMEASQNLSTIAVMKEQMGLLKNEENAIRDEASKRMSYLESGVQELRNTLDREEFAKSETMLRLRQVEMLNGNDGGVSPSALHSEVGELRRRLKQQEEFQARSQQAWRHEIEMVRRQQHVSSQQSSSMPLSSKTSDAGWEYVQSQGSQKGISYPVGSEVRSPEISSPNLRSPVNRSKVTSEEQNIAPPIVQDADMGGPNGPSMPSNTEAAQDSSRFRTFLASGGYGAGDADARQSERANAFRGAQLQDLLKTQGMWRQPMSSSSTSRSQPNIFKENDENGAENLITRLIEEDVREADEERTRDRERWRRLESEQQARMDELRSELRHARNNENRLRGDRGYWRPEAEYYRQEHQQGGGYDEGEEEEEVTPSESPTNLGPNGPGGGGPGGGGGGDPKKSPSHHSGPRGGDPQDRLPMHQQVVADPTSPKSRYPEGKLTRSSCPHSRE